jgi:hypothetical protein
VGFFHQLDLRGQLQGSTKYYYSRYFRHVYAHTRNIIQYQGDCAQYNDFLFYTLRPGTCVFKNEEFETKVHVNSLGLRDDEISLKSPKVIFLGDSHAMGWGVQQEETFPQIFENVTGLSTLNGGISSYGTQREMMLLKEINLKETQYVFIQYSKNDLEENKMFYEDGFLKISGQEQYRKLIKKHEKDKAYYLGRYSRVFVNLVVLKIAKKLESMPSKNSAPVATKTDAEYFINVLEKAGLDPSGPKIIVFDVGIYNKNDPKFINDLATLIKGSSLENMVSTVDVSGIFVQDDYFNLDAHMNNRGHRKIAQFLSNAYSSEVGHVQTGHPSP